MQPAEVKVHLDHLFKGAKQVIVGQDEVLKQILVAILCDSHALLEGYPGLAKTLAVRTIAALLEAMQEKQVTVGTKTYKLDRPFFVLATQNPIEQEGTFPLPEAQSDRFLLKIKTEYPSF